MTFDPEHLAYLFAGAAIGALVVGLPIVYTVARRAVRDGMAEFRSEIDRIKKSIEEHHHAPGHAMSLSLVEQLRSEISDVRAYSDGKAKDAKKMDAAAYFELRRIADNEVPHLSARITLLEKALKDPDEGTDST